jgi:hypothetical protein
MTGIGTQKRNEQEKSLYSGPAHCTGAIETAVPLSSDFHSISEEANRECQQRQESNSSDPMSVRWNLHLCLLGIAAGMLVTGISYGALEMLLFKQYRDNQQNGADTLGGHAQYAILKVLSHLGDLFYVLICIGFGWILTSSGNACAQRCLLRSTENSILVDDKYDESESDTTLYLNARVVFVMIVYLEVGFLLGASCMDLIVDILLGIPLSLFGFGSAIALDMIVYCLLIWCYDLLGLAKMDSTEESDEHIIKQDEEQYFYIQIV